MTPSNANRSGLDHFGWWVEHTVAEPMFIRPPAFCPAGENYTITSLVTAASAQAAIDEQEETIESLKRLVDQHYDRATAAEARADMLAKALERIERWFGEFPETGKFWPNNDGSESDRPMSYGACWGSNGERDYMRSIARAALETQP